MRATSSPSWSCSRARTAGCTWTSRTRSSPARASRVTSRRRAPDAHHEPVDPRARRLRRLRGDLQGAQHAAHAPDVGHERDPRHRRARRHHPARRGRRTGGAEQAAARHRRGLRHDQCRRRLPRHRPHARDVQEQAQGADRGGAGGGRGVTFITASFVTDEEFREVLYIVAFSLFIYGLSGLTGPKTAVRGNRIAAVGMAVAVIATLLLPEIHNLGLIILGVVVGTIVGVPAARNVKMTQMPQMVALFNGVGGGAVALIAWTEFRTSDGFSGVPTYV